jgi:ABC-type nickel/cobalt efflux system permease component RcnA
MTNVPDTESGHDPRELHHPGDIPDEPHGAADHGEDHGHDDHAHAAEELGPVDTRLWGAFVFGVVLGLIPAVGIFLAIQ